MTKEEVLNTIIERYKNGSTSALSDYCDRARCADCPFITEDCADDVVMAILDRLVKAEEKKETNLEHWYDSFERTTLCTYIHLREEACRFYKDSDADTMLEWLLAPYEEPKQKYKLSKLEFDLLDYCCYKQQDDTLKDWTVLKDMHDKGHYKGIPEETKIRDILGNCEVIEE